MIGPAGRGRGLQCYTRQATWIKGVGLPGRKGRRRKGANGKRQRDGKLQKSKMKNVGREKKRGR